MGYKSLFLVEDNPIFVEFFIQSVALLEENCHVTVCRTGGEALDQLKADERSLDLALVDLGLPDMDGIEVIRALAQLPRSFPIMVVSVNRTPSRLFEAIRAGAHGYVVKGDAELSVMRAMEQLMQGIYPISPLGHLD